MQKKYAIPNLNAVKIIYYFLGIFLFPVLLSASNNVNNLQWIENNLVTIFDSVNVSGYSNLANTEFEFGSVYGDKFGFIESQLIKYFDANKTSGAHQQDSTLLRIELFDTGIVYEQKSTGFLNLETEYIRKNKITLTGWLENKKNHEILLSLDVNKTFSELLNTDNFSELEESPYSFTIGTTTELSLWQEVLEPVMVVTSVAVIVYLFYTVRS